MIAMVAMIAPIAIACASERPVVAPPIEVRSSPPSSRRDVVRIDPRPTARQAASGDLDLALELDLKLSELFAQRRLISQDIVAVDGHRAWPDKVRSLWSRIVILCDDFLKRPPGDFPVPLIVRTRVGLDTEYEATVSQHGRAPAEISGALKDVYAQLNKHLHSPNSPPLEAAGPEMRLSWPMGQPMITSKFGKRVDPIIEGDVSRFHAGIDLGGSTGDPVLAAASGRVTYSGWLEGRGNTVVVQHGNGFVTVYAHLSELLVEVGARVAPSTPVGLVGSTGRATGPHLHFEVRRRGVPVDPEPLLPALASTAALRL